ncbi:universal stress protein [uncultured Gelidibacter sp.]|uniref:universal stress protein n=1 Tax=uncultured Gelidibacter sp. TaxID=259318 RepID=UPI0026323AF3|nr:universal stress protein [uncultured Gelidibacter sp.]
MKNILLLTDFSDSAKNAIDYALRFFKNEKCTFHVLYVQDSTVYTTDDIVSQASTSLYDSLINKNRIKLIEYVAELESEFETQNFSFQIMVDFDSIIGSIKQSITHKNIDLIVMGTNGVTGAKEVVFGSNTLNVIRRVACTTLIVPEAYTYQEPKEILLALDSSDKIKGQPIVDFFKFITAHKLKTHILRCNPKVQDPHADEADRREIGGFMKDASFTYHMIKEAPMEHAVATYLQTNAIDILGLIKKDETFVERLFMGSTTTEISKHTHFPMLIFHA